MIPRIFHQVWLGSAPIPDEYVQYRATWAKLHPAWEFRIWTEENIPETLLQPEVRNRLRVPAERADLLRLEVLHQQGGVYIDTDMECLRSIDDLIAGLDFFIADSKPGHINNAVIGALPQHPLLTRIIGECRPREFHGYDKGAAGPHLVDRVVREHEGVKIFEPWVFYPATPEERARAYAIHHIARSWKDAEGFREATLLAEKRMRGFQDDLWRVMKELEAAVQEEDPEEMRARLSVLLSQDALRSASPSEKAKGKAERRARQEMRARRRKADPDRPAPRLDGLAQSVARVEQALERLDQRLGRIESRASELKTREAKALPRDKADDRERQRASEPPVPPAPKAAKSEKARNVPKAAKAAQSPGEERAPRRSRVARVSKVVRGRWKRARQMARQAHRTLLRWKNMRHRFSYATRLDRVYDRDELPALLNRRRLLGIGVEIGVKTGRFSDLLLTQWKGKRLISVDPWREDAPETYVDRANVPQQQQEQFYKEARRRLAAHGSRSVIWRKTSAEAAKDVADGSLDFVYIDARHDYDSVREDLMLWYDKVRPGGILAGHDYADGVFEQGVFGVKRAVDEFFADLNLQVFATQGRQPVELFASWLVEKPRATAGRPAESKWSANDAGAHVASVHK